MSSKGNLYKDIIFYLVIIIAAAIAIYIYRDTIEAWFFIDKDAVSQKIASAKSKHGTVNHSKEKKNELLNLPHIDEVTLSPTIFKEVNQLFEETEKIRAALSKDTLDGVQKSAEDIGTTIHDIEAQTGPDNDKSKSIISPILEGVRNNILAKLQKTDNIEEARKLFSFLSQSLFTIADADPRLKEGWNIFSCPMAKNFPKWFQHSPQIENPYMGQKMLMCGSKTTWDEKPKEEAHHHEHTENSDDIAYYTCPMHPAVHEKEMGQCPICGMDLTPVTKESLKTGTLIIDNERRQRIGVRTEILHKTNLTRQIPLTAEITWDESQIYDITARVDGWVEDLNAERTGDPVKKNAVLLRYYSPDLFATQRELLAAPPESKLASAAKERLRLLGVSSWEINNILKRQQPTEKINIYSPISGIILKKEVNNGSRIKTGALLFQLVDPSVVWAIAEVYEQDLRNVHLGEGVIVHFPNSTSDQQAIDAKVSYIYPEVDPSTRAGKIRIDLSNKGNLRPGMMATVDLTLDYKDVFAIPVDAVIYTGKRRLVFLDIGDGRLQPTEVEVGDRIGERLVITKGLKEGDAVVTSGVFLLAAESRIRSAASYWNSSDSEHPDHPDNMAMPDTSHHPEDAAHADHSHMHMGHGGN